jgi:hypothetical protein
MNEKQIWITFQKKGLHRFPAAETEDTLSDVKYLGSIHRHLFKFKISIEVWHNDREIEFHQFLNWVESLYEKNVLDLDFKSCEMLSDDLYGVINKKFPNRSVIIEISEDGECGVTCNYPK